MAERTEVLIAEQGSVASQHSLADLGAVADKLRAIEEELREGSPVSARLV